MSGNRTAEKGAAAGPLHGVKVIELAALGPVPFAGMVLSDLGADVVRVDRTVPGSLAYGDPSKDVLGRNKRSVAIDLKHAEGLRVLVDLALGADVLIEGFRPGVAERIGIGPERLREANRRLVYGRMTGWGRDGPLATTAGHDVNYISLSGVLAAIGRSGERPVPPLNLVGDFGGGGMLLALGVVSALLERERSGLGQVVDAAMVDGSALLMAWHYGVHAQGLWREERGTNLLDTGAPFYDVYETSDHRFVAVGPLEPEFYRHLLSLLGLGNDADFTPQEDDDAWPIRSERLRELFSSRTRDEWCELFEGSDACVTPVLSMDEAPRHPHNIARSTFVTVDGVLQPAPAPRFDATPLAIPRPPPRPGQHSEEVLRELGRSPGEIERLFADGVLV